MDWHTFEVTQQINNNLISNSKYKPCFTAPTPLEAGGHAPYLCAIRTGEVSDLVPLYITRDILARTYSLGVHSKYELRLHTRQSYFTLEARSKADEINYTFQVAAQVLSYTDYFKNSNLSLNPLKPELNPIFYLLALLGAHHFLHVSRIRVKLLTFRRLMSYIYIWSTHSWCF